MRPACRIRPALDLEIISAEPSTGIKPLKSLNPIDHHTWTETEIARFEGHWATCTAPRLALALLLHRAQRRSDVVGLGSNHPAAGRISPTEHRTSTKVQAPLHPDLAEPQPTDRPTFLLRRRGRPYSGDGFRHRLRKACDTAGLDDRSAHGQHKAAARRLAEAGCSLSKIAAITSHKTLAELSDMSRIARAAAPPVPWFRSPADLLCLATEASGGGEDGVGGLGPAEWLWSGVVGVEETADVAFQLLTGTMHTVPVLLFGQGDQAAPDLAVRSMARRPSIRSVEGRRSGDRRRARIGLVWCVASSSRMRWTSRSAGTFASNYARNVQNALDRFVG